MGPESLLVTFLVPNKGPVSSMLSLNVTAISWIPAPAGLSNHYPS